MLSELGMWPRKRKKTKIWDADDGKRNKRKNITKPKTMKRCQMFWYNFDGKENRNKRTSTTLNFMRITSSIIAGLSKSFVLLLPKKLPCVKAKTCSWCLYRFGDSERYSNFFSHLAIFDIKKFRSPRRIQIWSRSCFFFSKRCSCRRTSYGNFIRFLN